MYELPNQQAFNKGPNKTSLTYKPSIKNNFIKYRQTNLPTSQSKQSPSSFHNNSMNSIPI
jgi:hypothetical protein